MSWQDIGSLLGYFAAGAVVGQAFARHFFTGGGGHRGGWR